MTVTAVTAFLAACGSQPAPAPNTEPAEAPPPAAAPPLDGAYRVTFDPVVQSNGIPQPPSPIADAQWTFRSACGASGCVATAASADTAEPIRVFDDLAGSWTFVAAQPDGWHCGDEQGPGAAMWSTWRIGPGPDGALAGTVTEVGADACPGMRTRAFGLASGGQPVDVPDPELEAARVVSPAHGLRGRYAWSNARRDVPDLPPAAVGYDVTTQCLRGGDRCVSVFVGEPGRVDGRLPVVAVNFADGAWTQLSADATLTCSAGGTATGTRRYLLALPAAPVPDPIERLSGEVLAEFTDGDCPNSFTFDATLSRTGD